MTTVFRIATRRDNASSRASRDAGTALDDVIAGQRPAPRPPDEDDATALARWEDDGGRVRP